MFLQILELLLPFFEVRERIEIPGLVSEFTGNKYITMFLFSGLYSSKFLKVIKQLSSLDWIS